MAITGTTTNTSGRLQDLLIFQGLSASQYNVAQPVTVSFGTVSSYTVGIQKLVQRYAIALLTSLASQPDYSTFGTSFSSSLAVGGAGFDGIALRHTFNLANLQVQELFSTYQNTTTGLPLDEQLAYATLLDFSFSPGSLSLTISITSLAGSSVEYVLPFPVA